jgi:cysteine synthase
MSNPIINPYPQAKVTTTNIITTNHDEHHHKHCFLESNFNLGHDIRAHSPHKCSMTCDKLSNRHTGLHSLDGGFGSGQFKHAAPPQTHTNTQGKEGWNITGLHLDGGFGSGQFKHAAPHTKPQTNTQTKIPGLHLDGGFGSGQFKHAAPPQTHTNTQGKEGWNITGHHWAAP